MRIGKCAAFLGLLSSNSSNDPGANLLRDQSEVFKRVNLDLKDSGAEDSTTFWDLHGYSFGKVNLNLRVDPESDVEYKFLRLASLVHKVCFGNELFVKRISRKESEAIGKYYRPTSQGDYLLLVDNSRGGVSEYPFGDANILSKTLAFLRRRVPIRDNYIVLTKKNVPLGSGLGGGSADAATLIRMLTEIRMFGLEEIGSDVPFLYSNCDFGLVFNFGDAMFEFSTSFHDDLLLLIPNRNSSTTQIFKRARELIASSKMGGDSIAKIIRDSLLVVSNGVGKGGSAVVGSNDLLRCNTDRGVKRLDELLSKEFKGRYGMSGSGSSFFLATSSSTMTPSTITGSNRAGGNSATIISSPATTSSTSTYSTTTCTNSTTTSTNSGSKSGSRLLDQLRKVAEEFGDDLLIVRTRFKTSGDLTHDYQLVTTTSGSGGS